MLLNISIITSMCLALKRVDIDMTNAPKKKFWPPSFCPTRASKIYWHRHWNCFLRSMSHGNKVFLLTSALHVSEVSLRTCTPQANTHQLLFHLLYWFKLSILSQISEQWQNWIFILGTFVQLHNHGTSLTTVQTPLYQPINTVLGTMAIYPKHQLSHY